MCESRARSWRAVDPRTRNLSRTQARPLTPFSMNFRDTWYSGEELVTGPVDDTALDRSRFHPTCKCCLSVVSNTAFRHFPRHFRFFEFHAQPALDSRLLQHSCARVNKNKEIKRK